MILAIVVALLAIGLMVLAALGWAMADDAVCRPGVGVLAFTVSMTVLCNVRHLLELFQ